MNLTNGANKLSSDPTGQYLSIPPFTFGGPFSFSCWFKKSNAKESWARIFDFSQSLKGGKTLILAFSSTSGKIVLARSDSNAKISADLNVINYCDDKWHHIVLISDGNTLVFFLDNVKIKSVRFPSLENVQRVNNYIGRSSYAVDSYSSIMLDDFRFYDTSLSLSDIETLFKYKKVPIISNSNDDDSWKIYGTWIFILVSIFLLGSYFILNK